MAASGRSYLDHDSYADCSNIIKRNADWLLGIIGKDPLKVIGEVSAADLKEIRARIKSARTISPSVKKIFGLYL